MSNSESPDGPPSFEDTFRGDDVEQRIYGTVLQTHKPTTASAVANAADCDPKTVRKYLGWFSKLDIVTRHNSHPATYGRNDAYFRWRRINQLTTNHSVEDLQQRVRELSSRVKGCEDAYGASTSAAVDTIAAAQSSDDRAIDDVYGGLGDWAIARNERTRYERARQ